ncbi:MAG: hypothetical protein LWW79_12340 [Holophagaceae bacterium]|nr:hypothetical protein [Holophagaceae bacterium]
MQKWLAIAAYRNEFDGAPGGSIDIRVLGFDLETEEKVRSAISNEPVTVYENDQGEQVSWKLVQILAIEEFAFPENGEELIGFIAESEEFKTWAYK